MIDWLEASWPNLILGWVALSFSLAALYIGTCLLTRRWHRWRRRKALELEWPIGKTRIGLTNDRRNP